MENDATRAGIELRVVQVDVIDKTMDSLHGNLAARGVGHEIDPLEASGVPSPDAAIYYSSQIVDGRRTRPMEQPVGGAVS